MVKYSIKRILLMLLTLFIIMTICFVLIKMLPVQEAAAFGKYAEIIQKRRELLGYNKPILVQYGIFWKEVLTKWNWGVGEEMKTGLEVAEVFAEKLPATMLVNLWSIIISIPLGIGLGIFAALKKNSWIDHLISTLVMLFVSVPSFVYAFLVQYIFCFKLGWLPFLMKDGYDYFSWAMFKSIIAPIMALSFGVVAGFTRITRAELTEVLTNDFMLLARTKGLTKTQATVRHALRNCMVVIFPSIFGSFIGIMSGSLIIESIFGIPGVGGLYLDSITARDYNFFMMMTAFYTAIGLLAGIVVDLSYGLIDPRIRIGGKK